MEERYSWKQMSEEYNASYYNDKDYKEGRTFVIIDNKTGREYIYPQVETRQDKNGRIYDQRIIDSDLWNEEFMGWAICNSIDFINYMGEEWLTPNLLNYMVNNFKFPEIFSKFTEHSYKFGNILTKDLWIKAFQRNNEVVRYVPDHYMTNDMIESLSNLKNITFSYNSTLKSRLTPELFKKIYFNCDREHKLRLISPAPEYRATSYSDITPLVTKEVAEDILSIDIRTIWRIPLEFISLENSIKAMESDITLIQYVPSQYQTPEYQKKLIDKNTSHISMIDSEALTEEMIYYALNKRGTALGGIPKERRTYEVCDYAVKLLGKALRHVPDEIKTSQMCFDAVVKDSSMIKYVPVEILNADFVNALNQAKVIIPMKYRGYVNECLEAHKKINSETIDLSKQPTIEINIVNNDDLNIRLEELQGLLTDNALKILINNNILTVKDLLEMSNNREFYSTILNERNSSYDEIVVAIKLLKCKFLDIDPFIDMDPEKTMDETSQDFGFSVRTKNALRRAGFDTKQFFEVLQDNSREQKLLKCRNMGEKSLQEILFKTSIVIDYYDKKKKKQEEAKLTEEETLESLNEELAQVRAEIQRLNARTDEILAKIQEKMLTQNKGGVLK